MLITNINAQNVHKSKTVDNNYADHIPHHHPDHNQRRPGFGRAMDYYMKI